MKLIRTAKLRLDISTQDIKPTIEAYTKAYNFVCQIGFNPFDINGVSLHHKTYQTTRQYLPSQLAISARMKATESLKSVKALRKKKQHISCPQSKQCSVRLDKNSYTLWLESRKVSILTIDGRKKFSLNIPEYFERYLDWKHTSANLLIDSKGRVFLHVVFEKEVSDIEPTGNLVGCDRGVKKLAVTSDNRFFGGGKVKQVSDRYQRLRSQLQSKKTRSAKRHLTKVRGKERRFRKDANHCISKQIVSKLQSGDTLVFEDLTGIRKRTNNWRKAQRKEVNRWNFFQLEWIIKYKAESKGINIVYVDARYTSQRCSRCGHIKRANRVCQSLFSCKKCGFQLNADLNASRNICLKYLDATGYPDRAVVNQPIVPSLSG